MERSVAAVFHRWLAIGHAPAGKAATGATGGCGRRLGTGHDAEVARVLQALQDDVPRDHDAYLRNKRDVSLVAEADVVIAAASAHHHRGELVHRRSGTSVRLRTPEGKHAGTVALHLESDAQDPKGDPKPHWWRFSEGAPAALATAMAHLAPSWVVVEQDRPEGVVTLRRATRRAPPRQWTRRLPQLRTPPSEGYR